MQAVFLYGPPGVGKLTVGQALAALTGFRLVHLHLVLDLATALFPRGSPPRAQLVQQLWQDVLQAAVREQVDLIVTDVYLGTPASTEYWSHLLAPLDEGGGVAHLVQLTCEREQLTVRLQDEARRAYGKLTDPQALADLLDRFDCFAPLPREPQLRLDTTHQSPAEVALHVADHFGLPRRP